MLGYDFYNGLIRKYTQYFGSLFSDINIDRVDANGNAINSMKIPIEFGPKERYLTRAAQNPDLLREVSLTLPRIAFEIVSFQYDASRKLSTTGQIVSSSTNTNNSTSVYNPVPYNIVFRLSVMTRNTEDGVRIVEQILPFFTPNWSQELKLITGNRTFSIPVILNSVDTIDTYAGDFINKEYVLWDLTFTMKAWFFGPVSTSGVIKEIIVNTRIPADGLTAEQGVGITPPVDVITTIPGLTANGQPTSNASLSIPSNQIKSTDDYGYIINLSENL
jgi:hypothetical protein